MTIQQMRYFYEVCKLQNITQAAHKLHIAQSTLSQAMQSLEHETGINLFQRVGRNIFITQDGQQLLARVSQMLRHVDHFDDAVRELAQRRNKVRIAIPPQLAAQHIPCLLTDFYKMYPEIRLEIVEPTGTEAIKLVQDEAVDMCLVNQDEEQMTALNCRRISQKEICLAVWQEHHLAKEKSVDFKELANEPLVLLGQDFFVTRKILRKFQEAGIEPNVRYYSDNLSTIVSLLQHHTAASILSTQALSAQVNLRLISFAEPQYLITCLVTKQGRQIYRDQRLVMQFLKKFAE